ncbi:hypothetical protein [Saccharopolyspora taberi]|uniref:DUF2285 domain-containing protein n=1 Tax=Saccharopolyspora taberi TaxID=60895 RepID=A0ABN3VE19_9PSEU
MSRPVDHHRPHPAAGQRPVTPADVEHPPQPGRGEPPRHDPVDIAGHPNRAVARWFAANRPGLRRVFGDVEVLRWDGPLVRLPDRDAVALFLRGRGLPEQAARAAAARFATPLAVTKRGMLAWARR